MVEEFELDNYLSDGWELGVYYSDESREKLKSEINFRTDSEKYGPWPYRLFPKISVPDLISQISK